MIRVLLALTLIATTQACLCPIPPAGQDIFRYAYQQAGTVVRAIVLSEEVDAPCEFPPCLCTEPPCSLGGGIEGKRIYKLRLLRTFKGSAPPLRFTADTVLDTVRCGIRLQVGTEYMLNMGGGSEPYFLWLCQFSKPWDQVTAAQRKFLARCKEPSPASICTTYPVFENPRITQSPLAVRPATV